MRAAFRLAVAAVLASATQGCVPMLLLPVNDAIAILQGIGEPRGLTASALPESNLGVGMPMQ